MKFGIQKRQWVLLLLLVSGPLLLNLAGIWQDVGTDALLQLLRGTYSPYPYKLLGVPYNPLPEIFLNLLLFTALAGSLAWLMVFISNRTFFQRQALVAKVAETLLVAWAVATVFQTISGMVLPLAWLPNFHDYLLGLPASAFMLTWSRWVVFPLTAIILCFAIFLSGKKQTDGSAGAIHE